MPQGMALHMLYGVIAGVVFVVALPLLGIGIGSMTTAVLFGLAYGFVLFVGAAVVFWMTVVLDLDPEAPDGRDVPLFPPRLRGCFWASGSSSAWCNSVTEHRRRARSGISRRQHRRARSPG